ETGTPQGKTHRAFATRIGSHEPCFDRTQVGNRLASGHPGLEVSQYLQESAASTIAQVVHAFHLFLVHLRHEEIGRVKYQGPTERGRRHTYDCERMFVHHDDATDHVAVILELRMQVGLGEEHKWSTGRPV